jgi:putative tricarboxylic transport membrane protein
LIPGAGATVATFLSYGDAMRKYDTEQTFGKGDYRGIIATEAANNGTVGGSVVPTIAFGVPGSGATAVLLAALLLHGIRPGPGLFSSDLHIPYAIFLALLLGNVVILIMGITVIPELGYLTDIDTDYIIPIVIVLCVVGTIILRTNWFDLLVFGAFGLGGLLMVKHGYSLVAFVLGIVLGPIMEKYVIRALEVSGGSPAIFVSDPLSIGLTLLLVATLLAPVAKDLARRAEGG